MKSNTSIFVLVTVLVALLGYWYFLSGSSEQPALTTSISTEAQTRFDALASELSSITFDTSIFSNPAFTSLVDISTAIIPESSGRIDPFAPLAGGTRP